VIHAEGLVKRYGPVVAVDHLSFEVKPGETFAFVGPNGAGKTTTLRLLLGLARPDQGTITVGAKRLPPHDPEARADLGYVPQKVEFPRGRTVAEVLRFFADLRGLDSGAVGRAIERVGLHEFATRRASDGRPMLRRVLQRWKRTEQQARAERDRDGKRHHERVE